MTTTDNNRIIAEFMGHDKKGDDATWTFPSYLQGKLWVDEHFFDNTDEYIGRKPIEVSELKFHSDWRWMMEVVDKIESLGFDTSLDRYEFGKKTTFFIRYGGSNTQSGISKDNKIEAVYNACLEFIQWYNQNKN